MGKLAPNEPRPMSGISIGHPNTVENLKTRKHLLTDHPLRAEDPDSWNNIPTCVASAISNIIATIIDSDESLFDYQIQTNTRIFKLQEQIQRMKMEMKKN